MSTASPTSHGYPKYTIADYMQWDGDWELWDGHAVALSPSPSFDHQETASNLLFALKSALTDSDTCHCKAVFEVDWHVAEDTVVRPDVMVVCEPIQTKWVEVTPTLVAEVLSPSTRTNDLSFKRVLYRDQGVGYYLILDPEAKKVEALKLVDGQYQPVDPPDLTLHEGCHVSIDIAAIWP